MAKILILANNDVGLFCFRKELIQHLVKNHEVHISLPDGDRVPEIEALGVTVIRTPIDRRGTNPVKDFNLLLRYMRILKNVRPDIVLTYTIKPNVYGGMACRRTRVPYLANITGLGASLTKKTLLATISKSLYKQGVRKAACVFFQNQQNKDFFLKNQLFDGCSRLLPGSGVNLQDHPYEDYPSETDGIKFLFIGRIMRDKGIEEYFTAAQTIRSERQDVEFQIVGDCEEAYLPRLQQLEEEGSIRYFGKQKNVHTYIARAHATILPSYHEGMSNVLLETAATGRPVLASRIPGCVETFDEDVSGMGFEVANQDALISAIRKFLSKSDTERRDMGIAGRKKVESHFDRNIVVSAYSEEINNILSTEAKK